MINVVMFDPKKKISIAVSVAEAAVMYANGIKALLPNDVKVFFVNDNPILTTEFRNMRNYLSWLIVSLVLSFKNILCFLKT